MEDIVTIDGPTSSGKNSVGFLLSKKLGYQYIDTGMIYRAGCLKMLQQGVAVSDLEKILQIYQTLNVEFDTNSNWKMFLDGEDVTNRLHSPEISRLVPAVSAIPEVRQIMKQLQRILGQHGKVVMGGRDIGSEIYPQAKFKFFLTAEKAIRAQRRFKQLVQINPDIKYEDVLNDMEDRDQVDSQRSVSPLRVPPDAVIIDNSALTVEQTVDEMLQEIERKKGL